MKSILVLTMAAATLALSQGNMKGAGPQEMKMSMRGRMSEELKLTDDQKKDFAKLRSTMEKNMITTRSKIQIAQVDLRQMFAEAKPDRSKIEDKAREIGKLETDLKLARTGFWFDVNNLLTDEQKATWKKAREMNGWQGRPFMRKMRGRPGRPMGYEGSDGYGPERYGFEGYGSDGFGFDGDEEMLYGEAD